MVINTQTRTRLAVTCPMRFKCGNEDCMHYKPHSPVFHGGKPYQNCHDELTICPIIRDEVRCEGG